MENNFNNINSTNAEQLRPQNHIIHNNVVTAQNKVDIQKLKMRNSSNNTQKKTEKSAISKLISTFTTMVAAVFVGTTGVLEVVPQKTSLVANFLELSAEPTGIYYNICIEDTSANLEQDREKYGDFSEDVYVILYNDFTNRIQKFEDYYLDGCFENLKENMQYTLEIKVGDVIIASKSIATISDKRQDLKPAESDLETEYNSKDYEYFYDNSNNNSRQNDYGQSDDDITNENERPNG